MTPSSWSLRPTLWLSLSLLSAQLLDAQHQGHQVILQLNLSAFAFRYTGAVVTSDAEAALYGPDGRVSQQLILGHRVDDITNSQLLFQSQSVTPDGHAKSSSGYMPGDLYACYTATAVAHVNAYNIHERGEIEPTCTVIVEVEDPPPPPKEYCPILLDLELNGFHLSGSTPSVLFDIDADGTAEEIAWTRAGGDDAFLCWDRNHNGVIDDGRELFGYATPLVSGKRAKIGYRALKELDGPELGGNQDGKVDALDSMFRELCAWIDTNRDGLSQANEIHSLNGVGVAALEYEYRPTRIWDQYGNLFRYVSRVEMRLESGALRPWPTYDVIFAEP